MKMIKKPLIFAGIIGVCLFLSVSAMAFKHYGNHEKIAQKIVDKVASELELTDSQLAELNGLKEEFVAKLKECKQSHEQMKGMIVAQMKNDVIETEKIKEMVSDKLQKKEEVVAYYIDQLASFYNSLTPEQKQKVIDHLENDEGNCFFKNHKG